MALNVGFDAAPLALSSAGELRYATGLLGALANHPEVAVQPFLASRRRPSGLVQRVVLQAAIQSVYYPLVLPRLARRAGVDVVHFPRHLVPPTPGLTAPSVVTIHDVLALRAPELFSSIIRSNFRLLAPGAARRATRIITGSEFSRREISELLDVPLERISVTPYGVDKRFRPAPAPPEELKARFGIEGPYVVCLGTLEPRKNLVAALRAFARVAAESDDFTLVVVGGPGWRNHAFESALRTVRARVVLTGRISDEELVGVLSSARCFLYPSLFEGFGFPPLEAMACGTAVITSSRASLPEVVDDAAILVDPEDIDAIVDALRRVLADDQLREELRRRGFERARQYTWERCATATIGVYREAAAAG